MMTRNILTQLEWLLTKNERLLRPFLFFDLSVTRSSTVSDIEGLGDAPFSSMMTSSKFRGGQIQLISQAESA